MPYYPSKPETSAWWDPDEVRTRNEDVLRSDEAAKTPNWFVQGPLAMFAAMMAGACQGARHRPVYVPRDRPDQPTRSCNACVSGECPMSPGFHLRGRYSGDGRFFELVDAMPGKKVWRCNRCGMTFRGFGGDNPANLHSC